MAWNRDRPSPRNRTRPSNWRSLRDAVLQRDEHRCYRCGHDGADQVDHLIAVSRWERERLPGDPHDEHNLAAAHADCVRRKNAQEANDAKPKRKRPPERHPGLR